ncbi:MAG: hydroxymethylbilane synthase, partial [Bdellovibrionales bacterium]|nr:hydroxymethylbilane synthase [Bdellovibrionales bacterium]
TKELDDALLRGEIDFAVHSMKDLPSELPSELKLVCVPEPEDPRDVFVSREGELFDNLPQNAIVGTSSIRRQTIIKHLRPDLKVVEWRGNIETRLRKLENNKSISGIILAHAGLSRLQLNSKISHAFDPDIFVPATGQGMLAIVCKKEDIVVQTILARINNLKAFHFAKLQREFLSLMEGGCTVPVGCFLRERQDGTLAMIGYLANSQKEIKCKVNGTMDQSSDFPLKLFDAMISRGAKTILADFKKD